MDKEVMEDVYERSGSLFNALFDELSKVIVGQYGALEQIVIALMCNGHVLVESNPGLGKTLTISTISKIMDLKFMRIQCTPDLMPVDITGTFILDEVDGHKDFRFEPGPIFSNIVLADEINRASPKTQSALLEAMQERQVSVGRKTMPLDNPFFVLATQNPIEMEGTFPLPEAQLDRFMLKVLMGYPTMDEERTIVERYTVHTSIPVDKVISREELLALQELVRQVPISSELVDTVIRLVALTRSDIPEIAYGASPRASIFLILAAKARAMLRGRNYVASEDIVAMAYPVLRHRLILTFEAERKGVTQDAVIEKLLSHMR
ncbi:MAG: AAA family ATPase [Methermicoccaceae archaeon]